MGYTIGKKMTAFPPHAMNEQGAPPAFTGPSAGSFFKVGQVLSLATGAWRGLGSMNPRFQWYSGVSSVANATSASFSVQTAGNYGLTARLSMGNATWGTWYKDAFVASLSA